MEYPIKESTDKKQWLIFAFLCFLPSCNTVHNKPTTSETLITSSQKAMAEPIPSVINSMNLIPAPMTYKKEQTYTVVVQNVPVRELLFSLARDAQMNLDIDADIYGDVTLNAVSQTLPNILQRITDLVPIRYQVTPQSLKVQWDSAYLKIYRINYLNMSRESQSAVKISTTVSSTGGSSDSSQDNLSDTEVKNTSNNLFWATLEGNLNNILKATTVKKPAKESAILLVEQNTKNNAAVTEKPAQSEGINTKEDVKNSTSNNNEGEKNKINEAETTQDSPKTETKTSAKTTANTDDKKSTSSAAATEVASPIIVNKESGIVAIFATQKQHKSIQTFLDEVLSSAMRQVLIEATVVEVSLSDEYQSGVDWRLIQPAGEAAINSNTNPTGFNLFNEFSNGNLSSAPHALLKLTDTAIDKKRLDVTIKALETFGDVKVMSRPKLTAINNQTSLLKVIDNIIYFAITSDKTVTDNVVEIDVTSEIKSVPVGLVMSVTPFIDEFENVTLNIRPTISRIIDTALDPTPTLAEAGITNKIPIVQVREVESLLTVKSGETAVIGGLMQDDNRKESVGIPFLGKIPYLGRLFSYKEDIKRKTELVIFIRPVIVEEQARPQQNLF